MKEIETSIELGVDVVKDLVLASWNAVSKATSTYFQRNDPLGRATRQYVAGLVDRYNLVKVLGMSQPVPLKSLYVRANILQKITARMGLRPEELHEQFDFDRRAFGKTQETVDGEAIFNRLQHFIVLGKPGAGKTTYLKFLALMMLDPISQIEKRRLPIFVTLREWADEKVPLMDFIVQQFSICGFEQAELFVEKMLTEGNCAVLFDGLDEVSSDANQDDIIRQIRNFTDKYPQNQCVISCRVAAYNAWFERFTDVEMADFNNEQIETFVRNWFHGEQKVAEECWQELKNSPHLRELSSVPLLLTLLCLEYGESNRFPPNRAELYERAIETLLTKWDSSKQVRRLDAYRHLSLKRKESMFARIAYGSFIQNTYFFRERDLAKMIEVYIQHLPSFNAAELEPDSRALLQAIAAQHGIFVERAKDVFSFAHLTFQEYFTAQYIVDNQWAMVDTHGVLNKEGQTPLLQYIVEQHLYDDKWREVFLLVAGMLDNADDLLTRMRRESERNFDNFVLDKLIKAAKNSLVYCENPPYPNVIRRNIAFFLCIDLVRDMGISRGSDIVMEIRRGMDNDKLLIMDVVRHLSKLMDISDISLIGVTEMELDPAINLNLNIRILFNAEKSVYNYLSIPIYHKITQYVGVAYLILSCLNSGCYVSKDLRAQLVHEMFLPKEELGKGLWKEEAARWPVK